MPRVLLIWVMITGYRTYYTCHTYHTNLPRGEETLTCRKPMEEPLRSC